MGRHHRVFNIKTDLKHALYFDAIRKETGMDLTGNSTVTLHGDPTVDADGLNLVKSTTQYAKFDSSNLGGTLSIGIWFNLHSETQTANFSRLFQLDDGTETNSNAIVIWKNNNNLEAVIYYGTSYASSGGTMTTAAPAYDTWNHIVWVINNENDTRQLYMNGVLVHSLTNKTDAPTKMIRTSNYIGQRYNLDRGLDGQIKSLNIWERALSAEEIADLYSEGRMYNVYNPISSETVQLHHSTLRGKITSNQLNNINLVGANLSSVDFDPSSSLSSKQIQPRNSNVITERFDKLDMSRISLPADYIIRNGHLFHVPETDTPNTLTTYNNVTYEFSNDGTTINLDKIRGSMQNIFREHELDDGNNEFVSETGTAMEIVGELNLENLESNLEFSGEISLDLS